MQPSYWGNSHQADRRWDDCFGKIIVPGENPATGMFRVLSANHLPLLAMGWDMKTGKEPVGRPRVSLQKGHCTTITRPTLFLPLILFMLPTLLWTWRGKHMGLLALEINWSLNLSPQAPDGPCGEASWKGPQDYSGCIQSLPTLREDLVNKRDTAALFTNSWAHEEMQLQLLFSLLMCLVGGQIHPVFGGDNFPVRAKKVVLNTV